MERTCQIYQYVSVASVTLISFTPSHRGPKASGFACRRVHVADVGAAVHTEFEALLRHIEVERESMYQGQSPAYSLLLNLGTAAFPFPLRKKSLKFVSTCTSIWRREPCVSVPVCGRSVFGANASRQGFIFGSSPREDVDSRLGELHVSVSVQCPPEKERWGAYTPIFERPCRRLLAHRSSLRRFHKDASALHPLYLSRGTCPPSCRAVRCIPSTRLLRDMVYQDFFFRDEIPQRSAIVSTNSKLAQTLKHTLHVSGENGGISARLTAELAKGRIIERRNSNRYHGRMTRKAEVSRR